MRYFICLWQIIEIIVAFVAADWFFVLLQIIVLRDRKNNLSNYEQFLNIIQQ